MLAISIITIMFLWNFSYRFRLQKATGTENGPQFGLPLNNWWLQFEFMLNHNVNSHVYDTTDDVTT